MPSAILTSGVWSSCVPPVVRQTRRAIGPQPLSTDTLFCLCIYYPRPLFSAVASSTLISAFCLLTLWNFPGSLCGDSLRVICPWTSLWFLYTVLINHTFCYGFWYFAVLLLTTKGSKCKNETPWKLALHIILQGTSVFQLLTSFYFCGYLPLSYCWKKVSVLAILLAQWLICVSALSSGTLQVSYSPYTRK